MRQLGLGSKPKPKPSSGDATGGGGAAAAAAPQVDKQALAAAALAAAKAAASVGGAARLGMVTVQEQRRFAGQTITVSKQVAADSKEAQRAAADAEAAAAAARKQAGLDAVLASLQQAKKASSRSALDVPMHRLTLCQPPSCLHANTDSLTACLVRFPLARRPGCR